MALVLIALASSAHAFSFTWSDIANPYADWAFGYAIETTSSESVTNYSSVSFSDSSHIQPGVWHATVNEHAGQLGPPSSPWWLTVEITHDGWTGSLLDSFGPGFVESRAYTGTFLTMSPKTNWHIGRHDVGGSIALSGLEQFSEPVPEPGTLVLLGGGLIGLGVMLRRRMKG